MEMATEQDGAGGQAHHSCCRQYNVKMGPEESLCRDSRGVGESVGDKCSRHGTRTESYEAQGLAQAFVAHSVHFMLVLVSGQSSTWLPFATRAKRSSYVLSEASTYDKGCTTVPTNKDPD
jgi:hypothetical protein